VISFEVCENFNIIVIVNIFQANCYAEESYSLSSLHCAEVSVDLKRARSLVRVNEIQSTLQEQRCAVTLFLDTLH